MRTPWEITREMFLSLDELHRLLERVRKPPHEQAARQTEAFQLDRLIIECLVFSGLRNSEFCRLRVCDTIVGQRRSVLAVRDGRHEQRTVFVPQPISRLIHDYVESTRPHLLSAKATRQDLVQPLVLNERGNPYERTGLYRRVVRILTDAGLGDRASVQLLRHTYGYLAYLCCGGNLLFVQRQLGHAHPMVTSIYAQFVDEPYDAIAESLWDESSTRLTQKHSKQTPPHRRIAR